MLLFIFVPLLVLNVALNEWISPQVIIINHESSRYYGGCFSIADLLGSKMSIIPTDLFIWIYR